PGRPNPGSAVVDAINQALELERAGRLDEALARIRQEQSEAPGEGGLYLVETRLLLKLRRLEEAEAAAEKALRLAPQLPDALYQRGVIQAMKKELDDAERTFRQVLERAPEHVAALNDLALLLITQGRKDEARELLQRVIAINPNDQQARQRLAAIGS
ncbi:MAG: tetratricopeptide repeat protein, partial [Acidobacteria bacterium]